jgi:hypothetical protein
MAKKKDDEIRQLEEESRHQHLEELLDDFQREPTIQDVAFWLLEFPMEPIPPRLVKALSTWLNEHNDLTIKQSRQGRPHSEIRDVFPLISRMHRDTGMSIKAACELIVDRLKLETDPSILRGQFDKARTPHQRFHDDSMIIIDEISKRGTPHTAMQKAQLRFEKSSTKKKE